MSDAGFLNGHGGEGGDPQLVMDVRSIHLEVNGEDNYSMVAFGDGREEPDEYVILQRALAFEERDVELGMDSHYFESNGQGNSAYAACKEVAFDGCILHFTLQDDLGLSPQRFALDLSRADFDREELCLRLEAILGDVFRDRG